MDKLIIKKKEYDFVNLLSEDEMMKSSIVTRKNKSFLLRECKNEKAYEEALYRYKTLYKSGIYVPKLVVNDRHSLKMLFEYFSEKNMAEVLSNEEIDDIYFEGLFLLYKFVRIANIELNYLPENFVYHKKTLYYTSLDLFERNEKLNLENYGLEFWFTSKKAIEHLEKLGYKVDKKRIIPQPEVNKKIVLISIKHW